MTAIQEAPKSINQLKGRSNTLQKRIKGFNDLLTREDDNNGTFYRTHFLGHRELKPSGKLIKRADKLLDWINETYLPRLEEEKERVDAEIRYKGASKALDRLETNLKPYANGNGFHAAEPHLNGNGHSPEPAAPIPETLEVDDEKQQALQRAATALSKLSPGWGDVKNLLSEEAFNRIFDSTGSDPAPTRSGEGTVQTEEIELTQGVAVSAIAGLLPERTLTLERKHASGSISAVAVDSETVILLPTASPEPAPDVPPLKMSEQERIVLEAYAQQAGLALESIPRRNVERFLETYRARTTTVQIRTGEEIPVAKNRHNSTLPLARFQSPDMERQVGESAQQPERVMSAPAATGNAHHRNEHKAAQVSHPLLQNGEYEGTKISSKHARVLEVLLGNKNMTRTEIVATLVRNGMSQTDARGSLDTLVHKFPGDIEVFPGGLYKLYPRSSKASYPRR